MGKIVQLVEEVKLISGIIISEDMNLEIVIKKLEENFGEIDFLSKKMDFSKYTPYYHEEMGLSLSRYFVSFKTLIDRRKLPDIKLTTNTIEDSFCIKENRQVNLDPGYLSLGQLFLASTKDNFFRIYIDKGIFEEVTLFFKAGKFEKFPWTYRDFASEEYQKHLIEIRKIYKKQLRA